MGRESVRNRGFKVAAESFKTGKINGSIFNINSN